MPASPASTTPIRIALARSDRRARTLLESRLSEFPGRIQILRRRDLDKPDLLLVDPCEDGEALDLTRFGELGGRAPLVVFTPAPAVDDVARVRDGRQRHRRPAARLALPGLPASVLVEALERIHRGDVVIADEPASA